MNQSSLNNPTYRSEIDGLRAFAVLSVVAFHAFPSWLKGGFIGVDVFFVISGFLITSHIFENLDKDRFSLSDFFGRRIRRIFPALILVVASSLAFGWFVLLADEYSQLGKHVASGMAFVSNFVFASEVGYFDTSSEFKPMLHLWSLAVEEQFYIFWPLLLLVAWKLRQNLLIVCLVVLIISFCVNLIYVDSYPTETFFWPFGRFWEMLVGSVLAWIMLYKSNTNLSANALYKGYKYSFSNILETTNKSGITTLVGLSVLIFSIFPIDESLPFPSYTATFPVLGAVLIIIGGSTSSIARVVLSNRLAVWFGLISYPLYLWHWPIISYIYIIEDGSPHKDKRILAVLLAIVLAWVTYQFVERPIRFGNSKKSFYTLALIVLSILIGLVSLAISYSDFKDSNSVEDVYLRKGLEHRIGTSSRWYEGTDNWLFLGNSYGDTVAKLTLASEPSIEEITELRNTFQNLATVGETVNTQIALLVGPNKSSVFTEMLPSEISVSPTRYVNFFLRGLEEIDNLTVYDPTIDFLHSKETEGLLYYRTDTHWNDKGAFVAFNNLLIRLGYEGPKVEFSSMPTSGGDLIEISELRNFPLENDDTWLPSIDHSYELIRTETNNVTDTFGKQEIVYNSNPILNQKVWVVGDSFTRALKPYLEATFREVHYLGHWNERLNHLSDDLQNASEKPNLVLVIRVERSF
ncbi:acyltransferase family protein [Planktomarina temperata]|nr:acyltransferase family protein [Planktomarina temperata]